MLIKVATDCSGIGSPEQALKELGVEHEIIFACERDKYARQTYLANFKPNQMFEDMTTRDNSQKDIYADLYLAGIPCQSFSLAGKRLGELDPRGLLFYNFYDYVKKQQPKYFIIENVKGLLSDNKGKTFNNWLELLSSSVNLSYNMFPHPDSLCYNVHWTVLNSKDFGVPQNRERVFIVGIRNDLPNDFRFPVGFPLSIRLKDILEPIVDEKYYLSDKLIKGFLNKPNTNFGGRFEPKNGNDTANCLTARYYKMGATDNYINEPLIVREVRTEEAKEQRKKTGTNDFRGKALEFIKSPVMNCLQTGLTKDNLIVEPKIIQKSEQRLLGKITQRDICPTLKSETKKGDSEPLVLTNRIRRLTPLECFRLQGFSDLFVKPVSDTQLYKQAGNSITVNVIKAILKNLLKC